MANKLLLPHRWKTLGWLLSVPAFLAGLFYLASDNPDLIQVAVPAWMDRFLWMDGAIFNGDGQQHILSLLDELIALPLLAGLLLLAFSAEKVEDEWIQRVRLESLQWAVLINTLLLMLFTVLVHGSAYFTVMIYNMFTPLLIFVGRFYYVLYLKSRFSKN